MSKELPPKKIKAKKPSRNKSQYSPEKKPWDQSQIVEDSNNVSKASYHGRIPKVKTNASASGIP